MPELHERDRYSVQVTIERTIQFTKYAESPEHAIEKVKRELGPGYKVTQASAVRLDE